MSSTTDEKSRSTGRILFGVIAFIVAYGMSWVILFTVPDSIDYPYVAAAAVVVWLFIMARGEPGVFLTLLTVGVVLWVLFQRPFSDEIILGFAISVLVWYPTMFGAGYARAVIEAKESDEKS